MFELILSFFGEFVVQVVLEFLVELGLHSMAETQRRSAGPWLAAIGYALLGALLGGVSLLVFPHNFVPPAWRVANLIVTPLILGGLMAVVGAWRARRGETLWRIDKFAFGFLFAFSIALVRFGFGA